MVPITGVQIVGYLKIKNGPQSYEVHVWPLIAPVSYFSAINILLYHACASSKNNL